MRATPFILCFIAMPALAEPTTAQLQYVCKDFVERRLNDPRDAQLEWTNAAVQKTKEGLYRVQFRGRAKNQYGALMLSTFECVISYQGGDNFRAVSIKVF